MGDWQQYFEAERVVVTSYMYESKYEIGIKEGLKMLDMATVVNDESGIILANITLGTAYHATERNNEAIKVFQSAYHDLKKREETDTPNFIHLMQVYIQVLAETIEGKNILPYLTEMETAIERVTKQSPRLTDAYLPMRLFVCLYRAQAYLPTEPETALKYQREAEPLLQAQLYPSLQAMYYANTANYLLAKGRSQEAVAQIEAAMQVLHDSFPIQHYTLLIQNARMLEGLQQYRDALRLYETSIHNQDSLRFRISDSQAEQLREIYSIHRMEVRNAELLQLRHYIILALALCLLAATCVLAMRSLYIYRRTRKSVQTVRYAAAVAIKSNEEKRQFLANMSYNIRLPLNAILGFSSLITDSPNMTDEEQLSYSSVIKQKSDGLMKLVNDVLDMSRLEAGMMKWNLQEYEMNTICQEAIFSARMYGNSAAEYLFVASPTYIPIETDVMRFNQVLQNMLIGSMPSTVKETIELKFITQENIIRGYLFNSPLTVEEHPDQETVLKMEINRLFFVHFGGSYQIETIEEHKRVITFTYPIKQK
jgi:signal transduction histidine kinase